MNIDKLWESIEVNKESNLCKKSRKSKSAKQGIGLILQKSEEVDDIKEYVTILLEKNVHQALREEANYKGIDFHALVNQKLIT